MTTLRLLDEIGSDFDHQVNDWIELLKEKLPDIASDVHVRIYCPGLDVSIIINRI